jgi:nanoRNase/pAp phosphatase (c-di-AMP/oligoRNAs hydrolase)
VLAAHNGNIELIRRRAVSADGVVYFDLADDGVAAHNKFIAYMLFPDALYTVGVTRSSQRAKISVGSNPWSSRERTHNIAKICERYGGGGHPVVGAVSLPPEQLERAREIAGLIRDELAST